MAGGVPVPASPVRITAPDGETTGAATETPHMIGQDTADIVRNAEFSDEDILNREQSGVI